MEIAEGTVLAHIKRQGLRRQIAEAKRTAQSKESSAITPLNAVAATMQQRREKYQHGIANVADKVVPFLETMPAAKILDNARNLEQFDRVARRNYGLDNLPPSGGPLNGAILINQSQVQFVRRQANSSKESLDG